MNGQVQGVVDVQHMGGEGVWSMDQLMNNVQRKGGGGSRLLELGAAADMGSWNSAHSSLQTTVQCRGGGHKQAGGRMGGGGAEGTEEVDGGGEEGGSGWGRRR
jgi:hypothetical protein